MRSPSLYTLCIIISVFFDRDICRDFQHLRGSCWVEFGEIKQWSWQYILSGKNNQLVLGELAKYKVSVSFGYCVNPSASMTNINIVKLTKRLTKVIRL